MTDKPKKKVRRTTLLQYRPRTAFQRHLHEALLARGYTYARKASRDMGVGDNTLGGFFRSDKRFPDPDTLKRICAFLEWPIKEVLVWLDVLTDENDPLFDPLKTISDTLVRAGLDEDARLVVLRVARLELEQRPPSSGSETP